MYCECKSVHYCAKEFQISLNRPLEQVAGKHMRVPGVDFQDGRNTVFLQFEVIFDAPGRARIAAGSLVSVGILLGVLVNPWFFGLSAFVGAGLVFAGVTDTCGMGMILAHMPWNNERPAA